MEKQSERERITSKLNDLFSCKNLHLRVTRVSEQPEPFRPGGNKWGTDNPLFQVQLSVMVLFNTADTDKSLKDAIICVLSIFAFFDAMA